MRSVQELYDQVASRYDDVVATSNYFGPRWLARELDATANLKKILDLGCATGTLGEVLRRTYPQSEITGVDISPQMIELAIERDVYNHTLIHDLDVGLGDSDDSFDLVTALGFMEFLVEPGAMLKEIKRVLNPNGAAYISFQEFWPEKSDMAPRTTRSNDEVMHHAYSYDEVLKMISTAGLNCETASSEIAYTSRSGFACPYVFCKVSL